MFLSFASHSSKLIEPKEGVVGTSDLQPGNQKHSEQTGLAAGVGGGGRQSCRTAPSACEI